jgi:hypothetical protein
MCAAIAGWLLGAWPATPLTLGIAAFAVISGPLLGIYHVVSTKADDALDATVAITAPTPAPIINVAEARARAFHNWRDTNNPIIERRERERRANRYLKTS